MRPAVIAVAGIGVVFAGATGILLNGMMTPPLSVEVVSEAPVIHPKPRTVQVLVAASALEVGRTLTAENLQWQEWPEGAVRREQGFGLAATEAERAELVRHYDGAVLRTPMVSGEPFLEDKVIRPGGGSLLALVIAPGMRSMTIPVSPVTGAGGMVQPGDRVDVMLTMQIPDASAIQALNANVAGETNAPLIPQRRAAAMRNVVAGLQHPQFVTETIMSNVRVVGRDRNLNPQTAMEAPVPANVTFEVTQQQAEALLTAQRIGQISLALRPLRTGPDPDRIGIPVTTDVQVTPGLQASRRGVPLSAYPLDENPFLPLRAPVPESDTKPASPAINMGIITIFRGTSQQMLQTVDGRVVARPGVMPPLGQAAASRQPVTEVTQPPGGGILGIVPPTAPQSPALPPSFGVPEVDGTVPASDGAIPGG